MLTVLLVLVGLLVTALAIRSRAPAGRSPRPRRQDRQPQLSPERRLWEIWKRLGWSQRLTLLALVIAGLGVVSFALYGLVLLVW